MEIELKPPYAETYSIKLTGKKEGKTHIDDFVHKFLKENHPGFSSESFWDYAVYKTGGTDFAFAAVMDRDFYIEKRLLQRNTVFYVPYEKSRIRLFKSRRFTIKGERRKISKKAVIIISVFILAVFAIIVLVFKINGKGKDIVIPQVIQSEKEDIPNIFENLNLCAQITKRLGGKITSVNYTFGEYPNLLFEVTGCSSYELVKELLKADAVTECRTGEIVYDGEKERFEIKAALTFSFPVMKITEEKELLLIQEDLIKALKEIGAKPVSSFTENGSGELSLRFEVRRSNLKDFNIRLCNLIEEKNLFMISFSETRSASNDLCLVVIQLFPADDVQGIRKSYEEENLSDVLFEEEIKQEKKEVPVPSVVSGKRAVHGNYIKIGSVRKDGRLLFYYRTEEGKIIMSEDEL